MSRGPAIGIDLGTTFSCVGVFKDGKVEIIANDHGNRTTPSWIAFANNQCLIGEAARNQAVRNPTNTVYDVKRLIGRTFNDKAVQNDIMRWPFKVINSEGKPKIEVECCGETKQFFPEQISSIVLSKMKETAEAYLDEKVTDAIITVPAYFNDNQRQATIDAGKIAGLNVLQLINEPTAAAIAYSMDRTIDRQRNVLIFDWGGGTFDVSILSIENGKIEVRAVGGDTHLGGEDIDSRLVDHFVETFRKKNNGKDITTNKKAISRLRMECESAKKSLSYVDSTDIDIDPLFEGNDSTATLSRARFEHLCSDLFSRTMEAVKIALNDANIEEAYVDEILLVGGSTRIPKVQELLQGFFKGREVKKSVNPDEAVAYGAALLAANLTNQRPAAMQDMMLLEVAPLSLGLEGDVGSMETIVKRNTPIPTKQTQCWQTASDNQTKVSFTIYEGERARASDNNLLGEFMLTDLPPRPRGETKFDVTFEIDKNSILHVSAVERSTGNQNYITITKYRGRLSEEEIEQLLKDAEKFKQLDEKERSRMAVMNKLVDYAYSIKRRSEKEDVKQKISEAYRKDVLAKCEETIRWVDNNKEATKEKCEELQKKLESECRLIIEMANLTL
ncbi:unnamed protein product [Taenia asiatica]|uniref:Heat shock protein 70 n=1 Tax=Taenia asiatica TaxID=60517 RepID=A0A0R3VWH5_TAEAS|nr:unnamed protein product [Taenia asiatica]